LATCATTELRPPNPQPATSSFDSPHQRPRYPHLRVAMAKKGMCSIYTFKHSLERCISAVLALLTTSQLPHTGRALTTTSNSKVPYHNGTPHIHGHDGLLPYDATAASASAVEHAEIRSDRYDSHAPSQYMQRGIALSRAVESCKTWRESRKIWEEMILDTRIEGLTRRQYGNKSFSSKRSAARRDSGHHPHTLSAIG
jgi:hypothetical protein